MFNYDKLKNAIANSGKTKTYLCEKMNRRPYYLRDVLRQKNTIPPDLQKILAKELGVTVAYLNDEEERPAGKETSGLSEEAIELINLFDQWSPALRAELLGYARGLAAGCKSRDIVKGGR